MAGAPDYSFMRSGQDRLAGAAVDAAAEQHERELQAAVPVFMEEALALASRYASFKGFAAAEPEHVVACLKVHAQRGIAGLVRIPDVNQRMAQYADLLQQSDDDDDEPTPPMSSQPNSNMDSSSLASPAFEEVVEEVV